MISPNYQPQLTSNLNQLVFYPDYLFSVYDYLQGIDQVENQILNYTDFKWPEDAYFDFTPFRIMVISANRLYAQIIFDNDGKILNIIRSEEHTSELQSRFDLVCRLRLEKNKTIRTNTQVDLTCLCIRDRLSSFSFSTMVAP